MKQFVKIIMSLLVLASTYAIMHIVFLTDLVPWEFVFSIYVPIGLSLFIAIIFYIILSKPLAELMLQSLSKTEERLVKMSAKELSFTALGALVGLAIANLIGMAFSGFGAVGTFIVVLLNIFFGFLGIRVARSKKDDFNIKGLQKFAISAFQQGEKVSVYGKPKVLDTSVIIDGRIMDLLSTGFIEGKIIVPTFVLDELRHIADSADGLKRNRGRRGLDILNEIQKQESVVVEIQEYSTKQSMEVDSMLLKMASEIDAFVVTNDYNLNKVAEFQGVQVLNINELANAIKPVVLPGEEMQVLINKVGKELGQGVAYLNDGTMIVVEGGNKFIGETKQVVVTSVLQTAAGRMIFAKLMAA